MESQKIINLPAPRKTDGMPLMEALDKRHTDRDFTSEGITVQQLADVLWAAYGVNRPDGKLTVPSAMAFYPLTVFAVLKDGIYVYSPQANTLTLVKTGDYRKETGTQDFVANASLNLLFFADFDKYRSDDEEVNRLMADDSIRTRFALLDTGHCSQNVYLYCASEGLKCVTRGSVDGNALKTLLGLGDNWHFMLAESVGK